MKINFFLLTFLTIFLCAKTSYSQIVINEICASNDTIKVGNGVYDDWIELYNNSSETVNLKGWSLSDNPKKPEKYTFKEDIYIYPGNLAVVLCNGRGENLNTSFKISSDGETIVLTSPEHEEIDKVTCPKLFEDRSFARVDNLNEWAVFNKATPGESNSRSKPLAVSPKFSLEAGFYTSQQQLEITCEDPSALIYYTLDGSTPTAKSTKYTGKITFGSTKVIRAVAVRPGFANSTPTTATYFINSRKISLPVVCLSTDKKYFWDDKIGFYVTGTNGISGNCSDIPRNWNRDWEYPVHFEYFDDEKKLQLSVDAGVKITGSCSRSNDQKSLKITARKKYGDNRLIYKFFPQKDISEFKSIVLRSGANDWCYTKTRDPLVSLLSGRNMNLDYQGFRACVVFLNGEYFGIHNIREKVSTHFIEENFGVDDKEVNLLENEYSVIDGKNDGYKKNVHRFAEQNDLSKPENYEEICRYMDVDNFMDYWITQIYIDNYDWPGNNIKFWNSGAKNSKWRWILFGTEYSSNLYGSKPTENSLSRDLATDNSVWPPVQLWSNLVIRKLLENEDFKADFIQRFSFHIDNTFEYSRVKFLSDSLRDLISGEWIYQIQRWPTWMGLNDWKDNIETMNKWYKARPELMVKFLTDYFSLPGRFNAEITAAETENVNFLVNGHNAGREVKSKFFGSIALKLKAQLPQTQEFAYWEINTDGAETELSFDEQLTLFLTSDVKIKLHTKERPEIPADFVINPDGKNLIINEVQTRNAGTIAYIDNTYQSWIEIFNSGENSVDMAGMYLSDGEKYYMIPFYQPEMTIVPAGGHAVFFIPLPEEKSVKTTLYQNDGTKISEVKIPEMKKNQSYGCKSDGETEYVVFSTPSPYDQNSSGTVLPETPLYEVVEVSVLETENIYTFTVYPNPAQHTIFIKTPDGGAADFLLTDLQGKILLKGFSNQINIQNLKSGVYIIKINGIVKKVVKI